MHLADLEFCRFQLFIGVQDRQRVVARFRDVLLDPLEGVLLLRVGPLLGRTLGRFSGVAHLDVVEGVGVERALGVVLALLVWKFNTSLIMWTRARILGLNLSLIVSKP